jgi:predicted dehydrogenase
MGSEHVPLVRDALGGRRGRFELVGVGASKRGIARVLAAEFGVNAFEDLRQAILHDGVDVLWLIEPVELDADERRLIRERARGSLPNGASHSHSGLVCVSCEPVPGLVSEVQREPEEAGTACFVPRFVRSAGWVAAAQLVEQLQPVRSVHVELRSGESEGTVFARLFDAMDVVIGVAGGIDSVSARFIGTVAGKTSSIAPEILPGMSGTLGLVAQCGETCIASGNVSNDAASWSRRVTVIGESGCLHVTDWGYQWSDARDSERGMEESNVSEAVSTGEMMANEILRVLGRETASDVPSPPDFEGLLGACEAARLSARTGQAESPGKMLEMLRGV